MYRYTRGVYRFWGRGGLSEDTAIMEGPHLGLAAATLIPRLWGLGRVLT